MQAGLYVYHTTMPPRHDSASGEMLKSYLGRANFIRQLNAAGRHAASLLGMEVVDYEAVASRSVTCCGYTGGAKSQLQFSSRLSFVAVLGFVGLKNSSGTNRWKAFATKLVFWFEGW